MKTKEFEEIAKTLSSYIPGCNFRKQLLFLNPLGHILRGIFLDRAGHPRRFYAQVFAQPLFVPARHFAFNVGWRLGGGSRTWDIDAPDVAIDLQAALRQDAMPFLTAAASARGFVSVAGSLQKNDDPRVQQATAYALASIGDVEGARAAFDRLLGLLDSAIAWQSALAAEAIAIRSMLDRDASAVRRQFDESEAETRRQLGLNGIP